MLDPELSGNLLQSQAEADDATRAGTLAQTGPPPVHSVGGGCRWRVEQRSHELGVF